MLVKVAERMQTGTMKVNVQLPGTKRRMNESCEDAMDRSISSDLEALIPFFTWNQTEDKDVDVFLKESPTYGIPTRYSRTTFSGSLSQSLDHMTVPVPAVELQMEAR